MTYNFFQNLEGLKFKNIISHHVSACQTFTLDIFLPLPYIPTYGSVRHITFEKREVMAQGRVIRLKVTIPSNTTDSNIVQAWNTFGSSAGIIIYSPSVLPETVKVKVSPGAPSDQTAVFFQLQDGSPLVDVTVPSAGTAIYMDRLVLSGSFKLVSSVVVAADRDFFISFQSLYT